MFERKTSVKIDNAPTTDTSRIKFVNRCSMSMHIAHHNECSRKYISLSYLRNGIGLTKLFIWIVQNRQITLCKLTKLYLGSSDVQQFDPNRKFVHRMLETMCTKMVNSVKRIHFNRFIIRWNFFLPNSLLTVRQFSTSDTRNNSAVHHIFISISSFSFFVCAVSICA